MIVPMKKVSLIILGTKKKETLSKLRKLGLLHIEISEGSGERIHLLKEQISLLESGIFNLGKPKKETEPQSLSVEQALEAAQEIAALGEEKKNVQAERATLQAELDRLSSWGELDPKELRDLSEKGIELSLYELPKKEYAALGAELKTLPLSKEKSTVKFLLLQSGAEGEEQAVAALSAYRLELPQTSTAEMKQKVAALGDRLAKIDEEIASYAGGIDSMKAAIKALAKEIEFETYETGMENETLSEQSNLSIAYFKGYIEAEKLDRLKEAAKENAWGMTAEDPTEDDDVPTKLKNNKFVSLI